MKKVLLMVAALIAAALVRVIWIVKENDTENKDKPVIMGNDNSSKNALIIYQKGRSSYSDKVAESIGNGLADNGYSVVLNQPGDYLEKDLSKYDVVIFGSPVYAGQLSSQVIKYAESIENYGNAKVICYCVGADENKDESSEMKEYFKGNAIGSFKVNNKHFKLNKNLPADKVKELLS